MSLNRLRVLVQPFNTIGPSARRHAGVVRALLEAGADASCHNSSAGTTALHEAAKSGNDLALRLLIGSPGIDLNARAGKHYPTGIHVRGLRNHDFLLNHDDFMLKIDAFQLKNDDFLFKNDDF